MGSVATVATLLLGFGFLLLQAANWIDDRFSEARGELKTEIKEVSSKIDTEVGDLSSKIDTVDARLVDVQKDLDERLDGVEKDQARLEERVDSILTRPQSPASGERR